MHTFIAIAAVFFMFAHGGVMSCDLDLQTKWMMFKVKYNKHYTDEKEEETRKAIWTVNLKRINEHNELYVRGKSTFFMAENEFGDMTHREHSSTLNGLRMREKHTNQYYAVDDLYTQFIVGSVPKQVDWRKEGYVTPVKTQGLCGSCWAFSTTGVLEGQHFKKTGKLTSLSESNLVDCSKNNDGCFGGDMDIAYDYIIQNKGIDTETRYPYVPTDEPCHFNASYVGATIIEYKNLPSGSEKVLQSAVSQIGPISVGIDASGTKFQFYAGGIYDNHNCSQKNLDHGVLVVGYGSKTPDGDYWIVKNSWGKTWGMDGYIWMSRNKGNQCGIATYASYPIV